MKIDYGKKYVDVNGDKWILAKELTVHTLGIGESYVIYGLTNQNGKSIVVIDSLLKLLKLKEEI